MCKKGLYSRTPPPKPGLFKKYTEFAKADTALWAASCKSQQEKNNSKRKKKLNKKTHFIPKNVFPC